jgi:NAD(P)-dependent dehydrogenase (short-subunit alcohol dehydrogenase family)
VEELVEAGARVVVAGLDPKPIDNLVRSLHPDVSGVLTDVADPESVDHLFQSIDDQHGRLDIVVAAAGIGDHAPLGAITRRQLERTLDVDGYGVVWTVQKALSYLGEGSSVIIIGSTASVTPPAAMSVYGGAKAAVRNMVRTWIQDIKGSGVRINVLSPGAVDTPSLRRGLEEALGPERVAAAVKEMGEGNPLGRLASPREIGKAVVFLASDASSFVTGIELFVDGGLSQV